MYNLNVLILNIYNEFICIYLLFRAGKFSLCADYFICKKTAGGSKTGLPNEKL